LPFKFSVEFALMEINPEPTKESDDAIHMFAKTMIPPAETVKFEEVAFDQDALVVNTPPATEIYPLDMTEDCTSMNADPAARTTDPEDVT